MLVEGLGGCFGLFFLFKTDYTSAGRQSKYNDRKVVFKGSSSIFTLIVNMAFSLCRQRRFPFGLVVPQLQNWKQLSGKKLLNRLS